MNECHDMNLFVGEIPLVADDTPWGWHMTRLRRQGGNDMLFSGSIPRIGAIPLLQIH